MPDSYVCSGAMMQCTMGSSPAALTVLPIRTVFLAGQPQANISDHIPMVNLAPFGVCRSLAFPATAAATAAALGVLTPMPCIHNTPAPWFVGKIDTLIQGQPALLKSCKCQCMWGGTISLITDGQMGEGTQYVQKTPKTEYSLKPLGLKEGTVALPPNRKLESKEQTEKAAVLNFAEKTWNTVSPKIPDISHKKQEFVDYVCEYVDDYIEHNHISAESFIEQKQNALEQAIDEAKQFLGDAYKDIKKGTNTTEYIGHNITQVVNNAIQFCHKTFDEIKEEINLFLKTDKIILWDAYWEKELVKEENQRCKLVNTKLRFVPQQIEVDLILVFYFKHDDSEHDKNKSEFVLRFDIPHTIYNAKEYIIYGRDIINDKLNKKGEEIKIEINGRPHQLFKCSITKFSSDLTNAVFPNYFIEKA